MSQFLDFRIRQYSSNHPQQRAITNGIFEKLVIDCNIPVYSGSQHFPGFHENCWSKIWSSVSQYVDLKNRDSAWSQLGFQWQTEILAELIREGFSYCWHLVWSKDEGVPWCHCAFYGDRPRSHTAEVQSLGLSSLQRLTKDKGSVNSLRSYVGSTTSTVSWTMLLLTMQPTCGRHSQCAFPLKKVKSMTMITLMTQNNGMTSVQTIRRQLIQLWHRKSACSVLHTLSSWWWGMG